MYFATALKHLIFDYFLVFVLQNKKCIFGLFFISFNCLKRPVKWKKNMKSDSTAFRPVKWKKNMKSDSTAFRPMHANSTNSPSLI
jgi:hypothetical protein